MVRLAVPPVFERLADAEAVLIAGAGGGFDVYCGLPLWFALREAGKRVHLANLSFSDLRLAGDERIHPSVVEVTAETHGSASYFPEKFLCRWFRERGVAVSDRWLRRARVGALGAQHAKGEVVGAGHLHWRRNAVGRAQRSLSAAPPDR